MPLSADIVGRRFGPLPWTSSPRRILAYRAALRPSDAQELNDDVAGGFCALPFHVSTPEWLLSCQMIKSFDGLAPEEAERGVVIGQDTSFFQPINAGADVIVEATITGLRPARSGAILAATFETRSADGAVLHARTKATTMYRDVACKKAGDAPSPASIPPPGTGAVEKELRLPFGFAHIFSECAEIWNPIHTEYRVARRAGLEEPIVHGVALWAQAGLLIADVCADGETGRLKRLSARFLAPAPNGAPLSFSCEHEDGAARYALRLAGGALAVAGEAVYAR